MSFNLVRNSRLFFTTNVDATTGVIPDHTGTNMSSTNCFEIQVLDGFSFSQSTQQTTIQINEAGSDPVRGQRAFNVSLDPVDISFSTYIRPDLDTGIVKCEESVLWNALLSSIAKSNAGVAIGGTAPTGTYVNTTGRLTISGGTLTTFTVGTFHTLQGIQAAGGVSERFNAPAKIITSTAGSLVVEYVDAPVDASPTLTLSATTTKLMPQAWTEHVTNGGYAAFSQLTSVGSNKNQLEKFGLVFLVDSAVYAIDNCVLDSASIDFALDGIATIAWSIKGTKLRYVSTATVSTANPAVFGGTGLATGTAAAKVTDAKYITNKLSTVQLKKNIGGVGGTTYTLALTGGNITISNNVSYVTPSNLGAVNEPIGYFTGSRSVSGNITAYLRIGAAASAQILSDIVTDNASETKFWLQVEIGGASNAVRVEVLVPGCLLQVPTVETADVVSTTINFTAQGHSNIPGAAASYDVTAANDIRLRYFAV